ncbi:GNAT family N-acetyltransferase [Mucilaginibacter paludis]|nr:GNAT family N-acetyltransferase [Mucilaginibacter paludis]
MKIITRTNRLVIREFLPEEEPLFIELFTDERLTAYLPKRNVDDLKALFKDIIANYTAGIQLTRWAVFTGEDNRFVGLCLLKYIDNEPYNAELGYVLHHEFAGKGMATEISEALLAYGFKERHLAEVFAVTAPANIASQQVLKKVGLVQGGNILRNGEELSYFRIKSWEWLNLNSAG